MGGISTGVHANPAHGNPTTSGCGWCVVVVVVAHCWVVDQQAQCSDESVGRSVRIGRWWCGCWLLVLPGTLLKPAVAGGGGVGGLLFVNYIVDASIFERRAFYDRYLVTGSLLWGSGGGCGGGCVVCIFDDYLCCVAYKLLRAHGGCLGIRS